MAGAENKKLQENVDLVRQATKAYSDFSNQVPENIAQAKALLDVTVELNKQLKASTGLKAFNDEQKKVKASIKQTAEATKQSIDIQKKEEQLKREKIRTAQLEEKQLKKVADATEKSNSAYSKASARLNKLRKEAKDTAIQFGLNSKEFRKAASNVNRLDAQLKKVDSRLGQSQRFVGQYGNALKGLGGQILGAAGLVGGFQMLASGINKAGQELKKNIKINNQVRQIFKLQGDELGNVTKQIQILSNTYEQEYNDVIKSANALSKEFGIEATEALDLISQGFEKGADNSGDFLEQLKEYPAQLKAVGLSADQTIALITQSVTEGIYSDTGVDAIKEAGLRLRDLTPVAQKALKDIGLSSVEIEKSLANGSKTLFEVIQKVSKRMSELPPQSKEVGQAMSNIFGGPGENAGLRFLTSLKDINISLSDIENNTSEAIIAQREFTAAWTNLTLAIADSDTAIGSFSTKTVRFFTNALNGLTTLGSQFELFFKGIDDASESAIESLVEFGEFESGDKIISKLQSITDEYKNARPEIRETLTLNQFLFEKIISLGEEIETARRIADFYTESLNKQAESAANAAKESEKLETQTKSTSNEQLKAATLLSARTELSKDLSKEVAEAAIKDDLKVMSSAVRKSDKIISEAQRAADKTAELERAKEDTKLAFTEAGFESAGILADQFFTNAQTRRDQETQAEIDAMNLRLENDTLDAEQRELLQQQIAAKEKKLKTDQAKADKKAAIIQSVVNTALSIGKTAATLGFPAAIPFIAFAAATGLAQQIAIASQPLPKFDKGTKSAPGGGFWAGEKRTEFMKHKGVVSMVDRPTLFGDEYKGAEIISGVESARIIDQVNRTQVVEGVARSKGVDSEQFNLAFEKAMVPHTRAMVDAIRNNKPIIINKERDRRAESAYNEYGA